MVANILIFSIRHRKRLSDWGAGVSFPLLGYTEGMEMNPDVVQAKTRRAGLVFPHEFQHLVKALPLQMTVAYLPAVITLD
jgi:hypothetical protein